MLTIQIKVLLCLLLFVSVAKAQHNHDLNHVVYEGWVNKRGDGCCNDRDCGDLPDSRVRENKDGTHIEIDGQWCPVLDWHYLQKGNAPNGDAHHVCITPKGSGAESCKRLLCYQPKAQY